MLAELAATAFSPRDFPAGEKAEIALAGRSNVGKSSLINRLAGRRQLARTSSTPGKTRSINFYRFGQDFYLVDLPGYGFAHAGRTESLAWKRLIELYFRERTALVLVVHLVDARHPATRLDLELAGWIGHLGIPRLVVATKADKLSGNERAERRRELSTTFADSPLIMASAVTGMGYKDLWNEITSAVRRA